MGPAERLGHPQVGQQMHHLLGDHGRPPVRVQGQLIPGHALLGHRVVDKSLGEIGPLGPGQHPAHDVAGKDVQDHIEVVIRPLLGAVQFGDVPRPNLVRSLGDELGFLVRWVRGLAPALAHLVVLVQDPVHGRALSEVGPLVEQLGVDGGGGLVDELVGVEDPLDLLALDQGEGPGLGRSNPFGANRRRALPMLSIPGGPVHSGGRQCLGRADDGPELSDGVFDHLVSLFAAVLSEASCSSSAESFPWISTTRRDLSSSPSSRSTSFLSRATSRSRGSAFSRPAGRAKAAVAPSLRWRLQVVIKEEYRPSRRSNSPRSDLGSASYSARILALYLAENCRRPAERSGTSGSGALDSSTTPAWWRVSSKWLIVVVMGEFLLRPLSLLICQGKPSH